MSAAMASLLRGAAELAAWVTAMSDGWEARRRTGARQASYQNRAASEAEFAR
ncbi:hypothetical protein T190_06215 [Sinorhizobium meliloti CCBAU 01290]|nr:hypothetical protein T190_06215 [Sinorhizobium meliloti CCBAU 01290]